MNTKELSKILLLGEKQAVELQTSCQVDIVGRIVCSFLNSRGGYVVCGVNEKKQPVGIADAEMVASKTEKALIEAIAPKTLFSVDVRFLENKSIIVIEVPAGKDIPYAFNNDIYIRENDHTQKADVETIRDMVMRRQVEPERWERRFSNADIDEDISQEEVELAAKEADKVSRIEFRNPENPTQVLEDFSVVKYGKVTNAGDLLFGINTAQRYPQVRVRAAAFPTDKADKEYLDIKSFEGPLVSVLKKLENFVVQNTPTTVRFSSDSLHRTNEPLYPREAVREGLVNALVHRDYSSFAGNVSVFVYPKRLEIHNSGGFPEGITASGITSGHISVLRNPDIAHVLYLRDLMEKLGRGSILIQKQCQERGLVAPEWKEDEDKNVILTFYAPKNILKTGPSQGPSKDQVRVMRKCLNDSLIGDLMKVLNRSNRTKFRDQVLRPLMDANLVEMTIPDKPTSSKQKYRLTDLGKETLEKLG